MYKRQVCLARVVVLDCAKSTSLVDQILDGHFLLAQSHDEQNRKEKDLQSAAAAGENDVDF